MAARRTLGGPVTAAQWERLKPLFDEAINLSAAGRAEFLAKLCAEDAEIAARLDSLLENEGTTVTVSEPMVRLNDFRLSEKRFFNDGEMVIGRFRIVHFLGRGGMGEVYQAEDMQLGEVALKTLRPGVALDQDSILRFRQEVQLARRVTSTNVCRIHDLFQVPGNRDRLPCSFLTMELLPGVTLADHIERDGPLPFVQAESVALELCAALKAIHDAGVIHRDFKSRNIMLVPRNGEPHAVVMDMGLARESKPSGTDDSGITRTGAVMGTPEYMAPEQFQGHAVTPAADIYALGIVLYELVTGIRPFQAATPLAAAVRRAKRPATASSVRAGVPKRWDEVISRCIEYDADLRYQSANEVGEALRRQGPHRVRRRVGYAAAAVLLAATIAGIARSPIGVYLTTGSGRLAQAGPKHLAVLPFANIGSDPANRVTSDGLLEILTSRLSDLDSSGKTLWVVPAGEVRQRKVTEPDDAVKQLGVNLVVTGSVQREEKGVRLTVNLVDPRKMRQIGSAVISERDGDYSNLEDGAVVKLAELLRVNAQAASVAEHPRTSPAAYEQYLEAMGYLHRWDQQGNLEKAIALFERAAQDDLTFHLGLAGLSEAYRLRYTLDHNQKWVDLALQAANRALEADSRLEPVYVTLGKVHNNTGQYELAMEEFERALNLAPRDADALQGMAQTYQRLGRDKEAESMFRRAIALSPDSWDEYFRLGNFYYTLSRFPEAESQYRRVLELTPDNASAYTNLGTTLTNENRYSEARIVLEKAVAQNPSYSAYNLASVYFLEGRYTDAAAIYERSLRLNNADYQVWGNLGAACAAVPTLASQSRAAFEKAALLAERKARDAPDAAVQSELGTYYARLEMHDKARVRLESALALAPEDPTVVLTVAEGYALLDDRSAAKLYLRRALSLGTSSEYAKRIPALKDSFK